MFETAVNEARLADDAYEAVRALAQSLRRRSLPAPVVHEILGKLASLEEALPTVLQLTTSAVVRSLDDLDVYEQDGGDPAERVMQLQDHLRAAITPTQEAAESIRKAQAAIARLGYRPKAG